MDNQVAALTEAIARLLESPYVRIAEWGDGHAGVSVIAGNDDDNYSSVDLGDDGKITLRKRTNGQNRVIWSK